MSKTEKILLVAAIALSLAACGGGGGGSGSSGSSGIAVDGYLVGATATCDTNENGLADATEPYALTDEAGHFLIVPECESTVLVSGGMNVVSDTVSYPFLGMLKAPAGSDFVTPLTTLMADADLNSVELARLLGVASNYNPQRSDPARYLYLYQPTLATGQIIQELADIFGTAPGDTAAYSLIAATLSATLAASGATLFDAEGEVNHAILESTAEAVNAAFGNRISTASLQRVIAAIEQQVKDIFATTDIAGLETLVETLQNPVLPPLVPALAQLDYLYLKDDAFKINGIKIPFAAFTSAAGAATAALVTIGFDFETAGNPAISRSVSMLLTLDEAGGSNRQLEVMVSRVDIVKNGATPLEVTIPATAQIYLHGHTRTGREINLIMNNQVADLVSVDPQTNEVQLDYNAIVQRILANPQAGSVSDDLEGLLALEGTFTAQLVVSGLNYRYANGSALPVISAGIPGAVTGDNKPLPAITGYGLAGRLVIAP